jgi:hypothetical protein
MRTWMVIVLGLVLLVGGGAVVWAAVQCQVTCTNAACGFTQSVMVGPTEATDVIAGYCVNCAQMVELRWRVPPQEIADSPAPVPPKPLGAVWNEETGQTTAVYACPICSGPFLEISDVRAMTHCPKCGKQTLEVKGGGLCVD